MRKLVRFLQRRREIAAAYGAAFAKVPGVKLQALPEGREHAWHLFTIQVPAAKRRALYDHLHKHGVLANVHYIPVHTLPFYQRRGWKGKSFPVAEAYYAGALSLPMHAGLTDADIKRVVKAVEEGLAA
jgi:dTDP-4-amino-4,6-dideoxygalactose transaminase